MNTLGPRNIGGILGETFRIYGRNFLKLSAIVAIVEVSLGVIGIIASFSLWQNIMTGAYFESLTGPIIIGMILLVVVSIVAGTLMTGAVIHAVSEQYLRQTISIGQAYRFAWRRLGAMIGAGILVALALVGIAAVLVLPGVAIVRAIGGIGWAVLALLSILAIAGISYLGVRWIFVLQAALLEGLGPTGALSRSSTLVKRNWWRVLGIMLVVFLITAAVSAILGIMPVVGGIIGGIIATPIGTIGSILLYYDLRVRKEGYTVEALTSELRISISSEVA